MLSAAFIQKLGSVLRSEPVDELARLTQADDVWQLPGLLLRADLTPDTRQALLLDLEADLAQLVRGSLAKGPPPGVSKLFVSYASADREAVEQWRGTMAGQRTFLDRDIAKGELWQARLLLEILRADQVVVMWSAAAAESIWVEREARFARDVQTVRLGKVSFSNRGAPYLSVTCLDVAHLPQFLNDIQADRARITLRADTWTVAATLAAGGLAFWQGRQGGSVLLLSLLAVFGALLAINQYMNHVSRNALRGTLDRGSAWLRKADVWDIIQQAEVILDRIYGKRLISLRSVVTSAAVSLLAASPALVAMSRFARRLNDGIVFPNMEPTSPLVVALGMVSLLLVSMSFDFLSLLSTRLIIGWIRGRRTVIALWFGIFADLIVAALCVVAPLRAAGFTQGTQSRELDVLRVVIDEYGSVWGWWVAVTQSIWQLLSLQIRLTRLPFTLFPTVFVAAAACLSSAIFPSLVHLSLLFGGGVSHRLKHGPLRWASLFLGTLHQDRRAPLVYVHASAVVLAMGVSLWSGTGQNVLSAPPSWIAVPYEASCLAQQELTQAQWRNVWDMNPERAQGWGLLREPAIFVGDHRPVETVSRCEAMRFCNLWSINEGLTPYYCESMPGTARRFDGNACEGAAEAEFGLPTCEDDGAIGFNRRSNGYRLPDGVIIGRVIGQAMAAWPERNAVTLGWFTSNAGFRTHTVGSSPIRGRGFAYDDFTGNVDELLEGVGTVGSAYGGAWFGSGYTRSAARDSWRYSYYELRVRRLPRTFRSGQTGFRPMASKDAKGCHPTKESEPRP